jgi:hypothetical protein
VDKSRSRPDKAKAADTLSLALHLKLFSQPFGFFLAPGVIGITVDQACQAEERGITKVTTESNFFIIEEAIVVFRGSLDSEMFRI